MHDSYLMCTRCGAKEEPVNVNIDLLLLHNVFNGVTIT